ncbi:MAG: aminoacyl-tRNA hydrolase [Bacteroidetes bacterium]|nr:aminoacyl-tRNA hydrolase [Bacteroidota bacterium]
MKYLIAGLGNIGDEYANTRHNVGFIVADSLAMDLKGTFASGRYASVCQCRYRGHQVTIIKPTTYMNLSGKAVRYWLRNEGIPLENLMVVVDDVSLPTGTLRMKKQGSDAGHNGLIDIITTLETTAFPRLRIGIGSDYAKGYQVDYVLGKWTKQEEEILIPRIKQAGKAIQSFMVEGIDRAMNRFNTSSKPEVRGTNES